MAEKKTTAGNKPATNSPKKAKNSDIDEIQVVDSSTAQTAFEDEELNLDAKVTVKNLAGWNVTFKRIHDGGEVLIVGNGVARLSRNEINAQVDDNNKLFTGTDGQGSHATIIIEDSATRRWIGFEEENRPQRVFTEQLVVDLFKMPQSAYEVAVKEYIQTRAEKYAFMEAIKKLKLNDYAKIVFASSYTGYRL